MARGRNFLDELIDEWTQQDPEFPELLAAAEARRALAKRLVEARQKQGLSQTMVAAAMRTAQSVISKLEAGSDVKLSTVQRYCEVIGQPLVLTLGERKPTRRAKATARGARKKPSSRGKTSRTSGR
ncbi:MAG: helix-turn-helix transcriptional regulator [Kofleriaceae bacterium]